MPKLAAARIPASKASYSAMLLVAGKSNQTTYRSSSLVGAISKKPAPAPEMVREPSK